MTEPASIAALLDARPDGRFRAQLDHLLAVRALSPDPPFVVQIGAFDGRSADPLYPWITAFGWRGILVEPQPRFFAELQRTYAGADGLDLRQVAVDRAAGVRTLYTVADGPDTPHWAGLLASFDRSTLLAHREFLPAIDELVEGLELECVAINDLLADAPQPIGLLQIDVEGYDAELVGAVDFERFRPEIVRFEHEHLSEADHVAVVRLLLDHGYRIALEDHDTLAVQPTGERTSTDAEAVDGIARLQVSYERELGEQRDFYEGRVAQLTSELERLQGEIVAAGEWAHSTIAAANAHGEHVAEQQRIHFEGVIAELRAEIEGRAASGG